MKKLISILLVLAMVLAGCSTGSQPAEKPAETPSETPSETPAQPDATPAADDGANKLAAVQEYTTVYADEITTINYLVTATTVEFALASNLIDTLVDYDKYGVLQPCLAKEWSESEDGLVWTFKLREGVKWVDFEGNEVADVTAQDFVDSAKYIMTKDNVSETAKLIYDVIKNGFAYYEGEITDFSQVGVKAIDDYTLEYTLENPVPYFESMLTYSCFFPVYGPFLEEQGELFGTSNDTLLYNGAYLLSDYEPQSRRVLKKNPAYWDKDNIFIEKINYKYNKEAASLATEMYKRGEISYVDVPASALDEWMGDENLKNQMRPIRDGFYSYFFCLNFDPHFPEEYEPENWKIAVNNTNFRKSLFHGLDRVSAMMTQEKYNPESKLNNTVTPKSFVAQDGKDFTMMAGLADFTQTESFNADLAKEYKAKAMEELKDKASFPVKIYMPYNTSSTSTANRCQVIKQQMENLLGTDYIEIYVVPYPPTGYLNNTRRCGNYAMQECNWGPDYADPQTYAEPFGRDSNYNFPEFITEVDENGENLFEVYEKMVKAAEAEVVDLTKRYELFAEAEAYLIDKAFIIPYTKSGIGYCSSKVNPFESQYSPFGVSGERYKGQKIYEKSMNTEEYLEQLANWEKERTEALKKAE